jgi:hypothetical protein
VSCGPVARIESVEERSCFGLSWRRLSTGSLDRDLIRSYCNLFRLLPGAVLKRIWSWNLFDAAITMQVQVTNSWIPRRFTTNLKKKLCLLAVRKVLVKESVSGLKTLSTLCVRLAKSRTTSIRMSSRVRHSVDTLVISNTVHASVFLFQTLCGDRCYEEKIHSNTDNEQ